MVFACHSLTPLGIFLSFLVLAGCEQQPSGGRRVGGKVGAEEVKKTVSYEFDLKPLIDKSCISCHGGNQSPDLMTYADVKKAALKVYASVRDGAMPPKKSNRWSKLQIESVRLWIDNGMIKTVGSPSKNTKVDPSEDSEESEKDEDSEKVPKEDEKPKVTYELAVKKVITSHCIKCHSAGGSLPELDTREKVVAAGDDILDSVQSGRMPETGPLRAKDKELLKTWVSDGKL
jgi:mono/diheme cytochrome c family protein